jgi:hypothetical protein
MVMFTANHQWVSGSMAGVQLSACGTLSSGLCSFIGLAVSDFLFLFVFLFFFFLSSFPFYTAPLVPFTLRKTNIVMDIVA